MITTQLVSSHPLTSHREQTVIHAPCTLAVADSEVLQSISALVPCADAEITHAELAPLVEAARSVKERMADAAKASWGSTPQHDLCLQAWAAWQGLLSGARPMGFTEKFHKLWTATQLSAFHADFVRVAKSRLDVVGQALLQEVAPAEEIAGGMRDGRLWKDKSLIREDAKVDAVLAHAGGTLCQGPGVRVSNIKEVLPKAPLAS